MKIPIGLFLASCVSTSLSQAAIVNWGSEFNFTHLDSSLFLNDFDSAQNGGITATAAVSVLAAVDYGYASPAGNSVSLNGVQFVQAGGARDFWGSTGINPDIDTVLSGHTSIAVTFTQTLSGLTIGNTYQIQLIGIHDSRGGSLSSRAYTVDNGAGDFTGGPVLTRGGYGNVNPPAPQAGYFGTVVGSFIADTATQDIKLSNGTDPGLSGYILLETTDSVPEPSTSVLLCLSGLALLTRRRK